jgi:hypothetical protein
MNREELKDKLDKLPNEWDQNAVWDNIVSKKTKKTFPIKNILLGLGILFLLAISIGIWNQKTASNSINTTDQNSINKNQISSSKIEEANGFSKSENGVIPESIPSTIENQNNSSNKIESSAIDNSKIKNNSTESISPIKTTKSNSKIDESIKYASNKNSALEINPELKLNSPQPLQESTKNIEQEFFQNSNLVAVTKDPLLNINSTELEVDSKLSDLLATKQEVAIKENLIEQPEINIPFLSTSIGLLEESILPISSRAPSIKIFASKSLKNEFHIGFYYGNDRHSFSGLEFDPIRKANEKSLDAIGAILQYKRKIGKNFTIEPFIEYQKSFSTLNYSSSGSESYLLKNNRLYLESNNFDILIFNTYQRIRTGAQVGYQLRIFRSFILQPSIGAVGNIWQEFNVKTVEDKNIVSINDRYKNPSSFHALGSLAFIKEFKSGFNTSIEGRIESTGSLNSVDNYFHSIRPIGIYWKIGKKF